MIIGGLFLVVVGLFEIMDHSSMILLWGFIPFSEYITFGLGVMVIILAIKGEKTKK